MIKTASTPSFIIHSSKAETVCVSKTGEQHMKLITLENGLTLFLEKRGELRSATVGVWVASGSREENESNNGISHFIEHIVFKGSKKRTSFEIAQGMDCLGAAVNAYTTKEFTFFYTRALDYHIEEAADILFDMVCNPRLDESDIETEKGVILEEIAMCEDDPADVCYEKNESAVLEGSSLSLEILGTPESVKGLNREAFAAHMKKFYVPERTVIGIGGSFDEEKMLKKVREYFAPLKNTGNPLSFEKVPFKKCMTLEKRPFEQAHLMLSFPGIPIEHEELFPLQLCMFILGTGNSSRLNQRIREQLGLVYSVDSFLARYLGGGYIAVSMSLSPGGQKRALEETCRILRSFPESITERELSVAKEKLISSLIMSREQPHSKLSSIGQGLLLLSKFVDDDEIIERIKAVTPEKLRSAAKRYLDLEKASFTAVGSVLKKEEYEQIINQRKM